MGARPMRRTIQNLIEDPVSEKIISSEVKPGDFIVVSGENDEIHFNIKRFTAAAVKA